MWKQDRRWVVDGSQWGKVYKFGFSFTARSPPGFEGKPALSFGRGSSAPRWVEAWRRPWARGSVDTAPASLPVTAVVALPTCRVRVTVVPSLSWAHTLE